MTAAAAGADAARKASLARLERLARLLDDEFSVGGFRFGLDALLGLVPGVGDTATGLAAAYLVWEGWRLGVPRGAVARMAANVLIDYVLGSVPLLGDVFDFGFKANRRNLRILRRALESGR